MEFLKKEDGSTLIEAVVGIIIIGILVSVTLMFFNNVFRNPKVILRSEALNLALKEINKAQSLLITKDTIYTNKAGNLTLKRKAKISQRLVTLEVQVVTTNTEQELVKLNSEYVVKEIKK